MGFGRDAVYRGFSPMHEDLVLLADSTAFYIVRDPFFHVGPVISFLRLSKRFVPSWVSC